MDNENKTDESPFERMRKSLIVCSPESNPDKNKGRSGRFTKFVIIPFLVLVIAFGIYKILERGGISKDQQATENETISKLVNKHNAVTDWESSLEQLDEIYVSDVQETLINKEGRPLLIKAEAKDIVKEGDKNYIHFRRLESNLEVLFILKANSEQTKVITENRGESSEFTVIASITFVRRANKEDVESDSDYSDIFIANGRCLDLLLLDNENSSGIFIVIVPLAFIILCMILLNMVMSND